MTGAETIVRAFGSKHESIESIGLTDGVESIATTGEKFVNVRLVRNVESEIVFRCIENEVKGNREFNDSKIRSDMAARFGKSVDEFFSNLLSEGFELRDGKFLHIHW